MATTAMGTFLDNLRHSLLRHDDAGLTDGELLECFITRRDEAAFEALVWRHGPMVLGVCRRVLRNEADAEDAFQATFLVLVRTAASIRPRGMVGNWLYGVAHNTARKVKAMNERRRVQQRATGTRPKPEAPAGAGEELQALLDQELQALPDKYRAPIVLCDLEGKSIKEAARQLGSPTGTIGTRLARGRVLLARRLVRHGLTLSGGLIATVLSQHAASAGMPLPLVTSTVKAASLFAAGQTAATGAISANVAALTQGVLKTMLLTKLKIATGLVLVTALVCSGAGLRPDTLTGAAQASPRQKAPGEGKADAPKKDTPKVDKGKPRAEDKKEPEADGRKLSEWAQLLLSEDVVDRQAAVMALSKIGPEAAPALTFALGDKQVVNCRLWAANALGKMGAKAKDSIPALQATLRDESGLVRIEVAKALWKIDQNKEAVTALRDVLRDKDATTRYSAAEALGGIGPAAKEAVPDLVEALNDTGFAEFHQPDKTELRAVSHMASKALKQVDPETAKKHGIK